MCWEICTRVSLLLCFVVLKLVIMMTSSNGNIFRVTGPLCREFTGPGEFPTQRPVTRSFDVFFDRRLNKRSSKQPRSWWLETLSCSLWRQSNDCNWVGSQLTPFCRYMPHVILFSPRFQIRASWPYLSIIYSTISWTHCIMVNGSVEIWVCVAELPFCLLFVYYTVFIRYGKPCEMQNTCRCWPLLCWNAIYDYNTLLNATKLLCILFVPIFIGQ